MKNSQELRRQLSAMDHRGYPAYKDLRGDYSFGNYILGIDHVQGDPFASPSRLSIRVQGARAAFPPSYYHEKVCRIALQDAVNRLFLQEAEKYSFKARGSGKSGLLSVSRPGQEVLERSAVTIDPRDGSLLVRFACGFPANGRSINAKELDRILFDFLPACAESALFYSRLSPAGIKAVIELAQDQQAIRDQLDAKGLCAFVADGSILPRVSGVSDKPMQGAVPFVSPDSLQVAMILPHKGRITGMGIRKGITLIVGGGYHGKSTLLKALERGVYNHIAGDGREYVITDESAFKIRSEDGRSVRNTDISMFINNLPNGKDTRSFYTEDASGSTSQAANVIEAMESDAKVFLIDEDTCASNFMVRDELMQRVVCRQEEPITPFVERVRFLYETCGISSVLAAGSSGSFFYVADTIIQMDCYRPKDITQAAQREAISYAGNTVPVEMLPDPKLPSFRRIPAFNVSLRKEERVKTKSRGTDTIQIGHEAVDLRGLEQIVDPEQTAALSFIMALYERKLSGRNRTLREIVDEICRLLEQEGLPALSDSSCLSTDLAIPRRQEIFGCFNRCRGLKISSSGTERRSTK